MRLTLPNLMLNFFRQRTGSFKSDILSGLTVALALVPEAIAFAFVAGVSPLVGLYSAFFIGLLTAIFGGRPGMISGATGAMAVVIGGAASLVAIHGVEYLFPTVILCGILQILIGVARLGKLIRMVPHSVMLGFVNGLAIVIGLAQIGSFKTLAADGSLAFLQGAAMYWMLGLVGLTMAIIWLLPKVTQTVPASLVAILTVTLISIGVNQSYQTESHKGNVWRLSETCWPPIQNQNRSTSSKALMRMGTSQSQKDRMVPRSANFLLPNNRQPLRRSWNRNQTLESLAVCQCSTF